MNDELKVNIQWLPGAILPIRINRYSTVAELTNFLQFSCFSDERIYLFYNGRMLNSSLTLEEQGVRKDDLIECKIVSQINHLDGSLYPKKQPIDREMARILDIVADQKSITKEKTKSDSNSSNSDSDTYQYLLVEDNDLAKSSEIQSDPLPILWQTDEEEDIIDIGNYINRNKTKPKKP